MTSVVGVGDGRRRPPHPLWDIGTRLWRYQGAVTAAAGASRAARIAG